jgi:hypothetical protein
LTRSITPALAERLSPEELKRPEIILDLCSMAADTLARCWAAALVEDAMDVRLTPDGVRVEHAASELAVLRGCETEVAATWAQATGWPVKTWTPGADAAAAAVRAAGGLEFHYLIDDGSGFGTEIPVRVVVK